MVSEPKNEQSTTSAKVSIVDARGKRVTQLDPVAMHLLHQHDVIPADDLRAIATQVDPREVKVRPWAAVLTPFWIILAYSGFFGYFYIFKRWRGWDPVLISFATFYFIFPIAFLIFGVYRARRRRWQRIKQAMLDHRYCPHCGYDLRGCPVADDGNDRVGSHMTVCSECGCAWRVPDEPGASL
ncbi:MAG: hypothetical protein D8M59_11680 [Planctomycetes bacterium]|nr:hypothetical protein [Planctomycetota bacterium]NOG55419.1 hypothetical protein [Planctomycetota bacterium]